MKVFSANEWSAIVGGLPISSGKGDDTFLEIEQMEESYTVKTGIDGESTITENRNFTHTVSITLMQSSNENDKLSALFIAARKLGGGGAAVIPLIVRDKQGTSVLVTIEAVIAGLPKTTVGKEAGVRVWKIYAFNPEVFVGGNSDV